MPELDKITTGGVTYDLKDTTARSQATAAKLVPDWSAMTGLAQGEQTASSDGWIYGWCGANDWSTYNFSVNGILLQYQYTGEYNQGSSFSAFVGKGDVFYVTVGAGGSGLYFVPAKQLQ